ncbi:MAG: hypothetical protein IPI12_14115 [Ignavibacteriales bacterium]|nr:hypothetical protein [Ignavibacteriales bacterium]
MGDGLNQYVEDLEVFQGNLYAGGWFTASGSTTINTITSLEWLKSWQGTVGTNMESNLDGKHVNTLEATATTLYAGGLFYQYWRNNCIQYRCLEWDNMDNIGIRFPERDCKNYTECKQYNLCRRDYIYFRFNPIEQHCKVERISLVGSFRVG